MKLNLLPTHVSKAGAARTAIIMSGVLGLAMIAAAVFMAVSSEKELADLKSQAQELEPQAAAALTESQKADETIRKAGGILLNQQLAEAMTAHSQKYPALYDEVRRYIPPYFRVTAISATPSGPDATTLTMTGVIQTFQQYADVMVALMRIPGARGVGRQGFQQNDFFVPPLSANNQVSRAVRVGEEPMPDDPQERLNYMIARGSSDGYLGVSGFGETEVPRTRGPMPRWSQITLSVSLQRPMQTPDPRASLAGAAAAGGGGAPTQTQNPSSNVPTNQNAPNGGSRSGDQDE